MITLSIRPARPKRRKRPGVRCRHETCVTIDDVTFDHDDNIVSLGYWIDCTKCRTNVAHIYSEKTR